MAKLILTNIVLFVVLIAASTYVIFANGYAANDRYNKEIFIIYVTTAFIQISINYLIFRKHITSNPKLLLVVFVVVAGMYSLYPLLF
jgi:hypothetical protein